MFLSGFEPETSRVWSERDYHYTTGTMSSISFCLCAFQTQSYSMRSMEISYWLPGNAIPGSAMSSWEAVLPLVYQTCSLCGKIRRLKSSICLNHEPAKRLQMCTEHSFRFLLGVQVEIELVQQFAFRIFDCLESFLNPTNEKLQSGTEKWSNIW